MTTPTATQTLATPFVQTLAMLRDCSMAAFVTGVYDPGTEKMTYDMVVLGISGARFIVKRDDLPFNARLGDMFVVRPTGIEGVSFHRRFDHYPDGKLPFTGTVRSVYSRGYMLVQPDHPALFHAASNGRLMAHIAWSSFRDQITEAFQFNSGVLAGAKVRFDLKARQLRQSWKDQLAIGMIELIELDLAAQEREPTYY